MRVALVSPLARWPSAWSLPSTVRLYSDVAHAVGNRPTLRLLPRRSPDKGGDARLARGVPWIFKDEAANVEELRALGKPAVLVNVETDEGREVGSAVCNLQRGGPTGSVNILARMVADNITVGVDTTFFSQRVRRALLHREQVFGSELPFYRLLNAEGDHLPGVICDRYGDVLSLQFTSAAMEILFSDEIVAALDQVLSPKAIIMRYDMRTDRQLELAPMRTPQVVRGSYCNLTEFVDQDGFAFQADLLAPDLVSGRTFADRPARSLLSSELKAQNSKNSKNSNTVAPRVLSLFGESLGVHCARQGAEATCASGLGEVSSARLEALAESNGCKERVECLWVERPLRELLPSSGFDVATLEPPALAPTYGRLDEGLQQYAAWTALAASALRPGGMLLVFCRSRTVTAVKLLRSINAGLWSCGRRASLEHRSLAGPADFPVHLALPGSCELQTLGLRVL